MSWGGWSELNSFGDYCSINNYVDENRSGNGKWRMTLEKKTGLLSKSDGCEPLNDSVLNNHKYKIKDHIHSRNCCYQDLATYYAGTIEDQDKISFCNPNPNCKYYY